MDKYTHTQKYNDDIQKKIRIQLMHFLHAIMRCPCVSYRLSAKIYFRILKHTAKCAIINVEWMTSTFSCWNYCFTLFSTCRWLSHSLSVSLSFSWKTNNRKKKSISKNQIEIYATMRGQNYDYRRCLAAFVRIIIWNAVIKYLAW